MRLLGIDYGTKRLGLAWADTTLDAILPYGIIKGDNLKLKACPDLSATSSRPSGPCRGIKNLSELITKERIQKVIVGFPVGLDGRENKNTERVKRFVFELEKQIEVPVELFDERFTSQAADQLGSVGASRDEKAAMVILEGYLESLKH